MRTTMYLLISCLSLTTGFSQSLSPSVIALAGGFEKTPSGISVSWTLGEPIVDPLRSGNLILTQGFQQPDLRVSTGFEDPSFTSHLTTFPNPVSAELIMETDYTQSNIYRMVDMTGKLIREGE